MADIPRADFYKNMRHKIREWLEGKGKGYKYAEVLLVGPDLLHLLSRLALDKRVPASQKAKIGVAIAYFVSPLDLAPEAIAGPAGYLDDIALAAYVLNGFINSGHGEIAKEYWAGSEDLLSVIQKVLKSADSALGGALWSRLKQLIR